jgi:transposase
MKQKQGLSEAGKVGKVGTKAKTAKTVKPAKAKVEGKVLGIGIDVSKSSLAVCMVLEQRQEQSNYANERDGIAKLIERLKRSEGGLQGYKVVMESTGRYHFLVALELSQAGVDVRVINPLLAKSYAQSRIRKVKTDKVDAQGLAQMALREAKLPKAFSCDKRAIQIRQKVGLLASLEKQLQALNAMFNSYAEFQAIIGFEPTQVEEKMLEAVKNLHRYCSQLEREINALILEQPQLAKPQQHLQSVPGFSKSLSALLVHFLDADAQHPKQWIAFLGLDLSVRQSGRWLGKGKLSKRGNPYLRKRLYGAAWGAKTNYPEVQAYYHQLLQQGHPYVESLLIIARKLLRIAFHLLKNNLPYDPKLAFPDFFKPQSSPAA